MRTRVKICCILSTVELRAAVAAGADAVGFVGPMPSGPGVLDEALIPRLAARVPPAVAGVLLTSATEPQRLIAQAAAARVATLQLVDEVAAPVYAALRQTLPAVKLIQVVHVTGPGSLEVADRAAGLADAILLDSGRPAATLRELGGTGRRHDWAISRRIVAASPVPVWLAGGLDSSNVEEAIRGRCGPSASTCARACGSPAGSTPSGCGRSWRQPHARRERHDGGARRRRHGWPRADRDA